MWWIRCKLAMMVEDWRWRLAQLANFVEPGTEAWDEYDRYDKAKRGL